MTIKPNLLPIGSFVTINAHGNRVAEIIGHSDESSTEAAIDLIDKASKFFIKQEIFGLSPELFKHFLKQQFLTYEYPYVVRLIPDFANQEGLTLRVSADEITPIAWTANNQRDNGGSGFAGNAISGAGVKPGTSYHFREPVDLRRESGLAPQPSGHWNYCSHPKYGCGPDGGFGKTGNNPNPKTIADGGQYTTIPTGSSDVSPQKQASEEKIVISGVESEVSTGSPVVLFRDGPTLVPFYSLIHGGRATLDNLCYRFFGVVKPEELTTLIDRTQRMFELEKSSEESRQTTSESVKNNIYSRFCGHGVSGIQRVGNSNVRLKGVFSINELTEVVNYITTHPVQTEEKVETEIESVKKPASKDHDLLYGPKIDGIKNIETSFTNTELPMLYLRKGVDAVPVTLSDYNRGELTEDNLCYYFKGSVPAWAVDRLCDDTKKTILHTTPKYIGPLMCKMCFDSFDDTAVHYEGSGGVFLNGVFSVSELTAIVTHALTLHILESKKG